MWGLVALVGLLAAQAPSEGSIPPRPGFRPGLNFSIGLTVNPQTAAISYYDPMVPASMTLNGAEVVTWTDPKTGLAPTQATATSRPTYSATAFNGQPGVVCDVTDDILSAGGIGSLPSGSSGSEIFILADFPGTALSRQLFRYGAASANQNRQVSRNATPRASASVGDGTAITLTDPSVNLTGRHLIRFRVEPTQSMLYVDGGSPTTASAVPATAATGTTICSSSGANVTIGAIYIFPLLSAADADSITAQFKARGSIP